MWWRFHFVAVVSLVLWSCAQETATAEQQFNDASPVTPISQPAESLQERVLRAQQILQQYFTEKREVRRRDQAIADLREVTRIQPDYAQAQILLYSALVDKAGKELNEELLDEIRAVYGAIRAQVPNIVDQPQFIPPSAVAGLIYWDISTTKRDANERRNYQDKAIAKLRIAIKEQPNFAMAHKTLGFAYYTQERFELALFEARQATRLAPDDPGSHFVLALVINANQDDKKCWYGEVLDEGIKAYKTAIKFQPQNPAAHKGLSELYKSKGLYDLAAFEAREVNRLTPSPSGTYNTYRLGSALLFARDYDSAISELQRVLGSSECDRCVFYGLGVAHFLTQRYPEAIYYFDKARQRSAEPWVYFDIWQALALQAAGRGPEAKELLDVTAGPFKGDSWEQALLDYHRGRLPEANLIARADNACKQTEAYFWTGYQRLLNGDSKTAADRFEKATALDIYDYDAYLGARETLKRLGK